MNQQGPIETNIPDTNSASNFDVFDYVRRTLYLAYRIVVECRRKSESKNFGGNNTFKNAKCENNFEVETVERKNSVIWNHKSSDSIYVDTNRTNMNQLIPDSSTNIKPINYSADIFAIEKIFS